MFVTNWISTIKIQKISEITNFFRHYFLSRTEVRVTPIGGVVDAVLVSTNMRVCHKFITHPQKNYRILYPLRISSFIFIAF